MSLFKDSAIMVMSMGVSVALSSSSWVVVWLGLEMNLLGFIPLMLNDNNVMSKEGSVKYFLVQAISSSIFIVSSSLMFMPILGVSTKFSLLMFVGLGVKIGMAPFHYWLLSIVDSLSWANLGLLMSVQKLVPIIMMMGLTVNMMMFIILSLVIGSFMMFNQLSLKKFLGYSSVSHLAWVFSCNFISLTDGLVYFLLYSLGVVSLVMIFSKMKVNFISQLKFKGGGVEILAFLAMGSMGGLPPFLGFYQKFLVLEGLMMFNEFMLLCVMLIMMSVISLFMYMKVVFVEIMGWKAAGKTLGLVSLDYLLVGAFTVFFFCPIFFILL